MTIRPILDRQRFGRVWKSLELDISSLSRLPVYTES